MKAKKGVVDFLNKVLTNELTAINQYFLYGDMYVSGRTPNFHTFLYAENID